MILLIDNYDSFTYNLYHYLSELGADVKVFRNNKITLDEIEALRPEKIVISPGPCTPNEAGISCATVTRFGARIPILGVCLGHQAIGEVFGGKLMNLSRVFHGVATPVQVLKRGTNGKKSNADLFQGLSDGFPAGRYHSWVVDTEGFPDELEVTATDAAGYIMAMRHRSLDVLGVQFHPESVLTPDGEKIMRNWLQ